MNGPMRMTGLLTALFLPCLLHAGEAEKPLEVRLISETRGIVPGKPFFVGLHLVHPPGAHTYWKNPGVVGVPTLVEWDLPPGFSAGEIQWPMPKVVRMASYEAQGYDGETLLMIPITPPGKLAAASVVLAAKVSWMCCGKTCHPEVKAPFSLKLPVLSAMEIDPANHPLFEKFRASVPHFNPAWATTVTRDPGKITLTLQPPAGISQPTRSHFFTSDGQVDSNQKQQLEILADGRIRLILAVSENAPENPKSLPGVVCFSDADDFSVSLEIDPAY